MNIRAALYYGYRHRFKDAVNRIAQFEIQLFDGTLRDAYRERYADVYHQAVIAVHLFHARDDAGDVVSRTTYQRLSAEYDVFRFNCYFAEPSISVVTEIKTSPEVPIIFANFSSSTVTISAS